MKRSNSFSKTFLVSYAIIAILVVVAGIAAAISKGQISASSDQLAGYTSSTCKASTNFLDTIISNQSSWYKANNPTSNSNGITKVFSVVRLNINQYLDGTVSVNIKNTTGNSPNKFYPGDTVKVSVTASDNFLPTDMIAVALLDPDSRSVITDAGGKQLYNSVQATAATGSWNKSYTIPSTWNKNVLVGLGFYTGTPNQSVSYWRCMGIFDVFTFKTDGTGQNQTPIPTAIVSATVTPTPTPTTTATVAILPGQCIDTDNGKNYFVKGITSFASSSGGVQSVADRCDALGKILTEFYCAPFSASLNIARSEDYTCPNGCSDGACIGSSTISPELLSITSYKITGGGTAQTTVANPPIPEITVTSTVANPPMPGAPTPVVTATVAKTVPPVIQITPTPTATATAIAATEFIVSGIKSGVSFYAIVIAVVLIGGVIIFRIVTASK